MDLVWVYIIFTVRRMKVSQWLYSLWLQRNILCVIVFGRVLATMDSDLILTERTGCVMELRGSNQNTLDTILGCVMSQNVECYFFCAV